jgi:hypothetical protein
MAKLIIDSRSCENLVSDYSRSDTTFDHLGTSMF